MDYHVGVSREDGYWVAQVVGLPGGATEVRRLATLEEEVIDLISGLRDEDPDDIHIAWDYSPAFGHKVHEDIANYRVDRHQLSEVQRRYEQSQRKVAADLREAGVSVRDAAELLDLSYQRVQQLVSS